VSTVIGGPVAGLVVPNRDAAVWVSSHRHSYDYAGGHYILSGGVAIIWEATGEGAAIGLAAPEHQAMHAWTRFMRALGVEGPRAIRKSGAARKRMRHRVR